MFENLTTQAKIRIVLVAIVLATLPCYFAGFLAIRSINQRQDNTPIADAPPGSETDDSQNQNVTLPAPGAPDLAASSDSGVSNTDNVTSVTTPQFTGICTNGDKISLNSSLNGALSPPDTPCVSSSYTITVSSPLSVGVHSITATASNDQGESSPSSAALSVEIVTSNEAAPGTPDLAMDSDTGLSNVDNITQDNTPRFTGICSDGDKISLTSNLNGALSPADTLCTGGLYNILVVSPLSDGVHNITANAIDPAGNTSPASGAIGVTIDTAPPTVPGTPDLVAGSDTGTSDSDNITSDITPQFVGNCAQGDTITINSSTNGLQIPTVTCTANRYDITLSSNLSEVTHAITAIATDVAGNNATSPALTVVIETLTPNAPGTPDLVPESDTGTYNTDNLTNDTTPRFTGTCSSNDTITLVSSVHGNLVPTGICASGIYDITLTSVLNSSIHSITAKAVSAVGASSQSLGLDITVDTSAPAAPGTPDLAAGSDTGSSNTDNLTSDNTPQFTGTCVTGNLITIASSINGNLQPQTTCASGTYAITVNSALSDGNHDFTAKATNTAGNTSASSGILEVTIDTTLPSTPGAPDLDAGSDTGSSNSDNITQDNTPRFIGTCTDGDKINLTSSVDGAVNPVDTVCSGGVYDITLTSVISQATHTIRATAKDSQGNVSPVSDGLSIVVDVSAPAAPGTPDLAAGSDSGSSDTDNITNITTPRFTGTCEDGATVTLSSSVEGTLAPTGTCSGGAYDITLSSTLSESAHNISAGQIDAAGNGSAASGTLGISIDTTAPAVPGTPDLADGSDTGSSNSDNITDDTTPQFTGTCETGTTVTISSAGIGGLTPTGTCSGGAYDITISSLVENSHDLTATQADTAGNSSSASGILEVRVEIPTLAIALSGNIGSDAVTSTGGTPNPGDINCPSVRCDVTFSLDDSVTLNVTVDGASSFQGWSGDCAAFGSNLSGVITLNGDKSCTATFAALTFPEIDVEGNATSISDGDNIPEVNDHTDFGTVSIGSSLDRTFSIQNEGGNTLNLTDFPTAVVLPGSGDFSIQAQPSVGSIASGGADLTFVVRCTPTSPAPVTTTVSIANNDADENPYDFLLSCTGAAVSAPEIDVQRPLATSIADGGADALGSQAVTTINLQYIVDNSAGSDTLSVSGVAAENFINATGFTLNTGMPLDVTAGDSATFEISFVINSAAAFSLDLVIANNDSDEGPYNIALSGTGADVAEMDVLGNDAIIFNGDTTPDMADHTDFGNVDMNGAWGTRSFVIRNSGSVDLNLTDSPAVSISGTHAGDFSLVVDATTPVPAGDGVSFMVRFTPGDSGVREATLSIASSDGDENPYTFNIQGTGAGAAAEMEVIGNSIPILNGDSEPDTADQTDFENVDVATGLLTYTFTIQNSGSVDLNLSGAPIVTIGGTHAADFILAADATTPVASGGGTTTFQLSFDPSDAGLREATISIANDDGDENPYTFSIQGTGTN